MKLVRANRPAAVGYPVPALEIDRVIFRAPAAPDGGRAAEKPQPAVLERMIRLSDYLSAIEIRRRFVVVDAAAFDQYHAVTIGQ